MNKAEATVSKLGGRIQFFEKTWRELTNDPFIISCVKGYKIMLDKQAIQLTEPPEPLFSEHENIACANSIKTLLEKGAISKCEIRKGQFISTYFLRQKPNGDYRFILNLKKLNQYITAPHFKMENIKTALKLLSRNSYMTALDLQDGYLLIPIHKNSRKLLRFSYKNELYEFNALPFGLSVAPYIFTKILKPVIEKLRLYNILLVVYLDDFLLISESRENCLRDMHTTKNLLESLGFIINVKKSQLIPSKQCTFLGFILDSKDFSIYLTSQKREKIKKAVSNLYNKNMSVIKDVAVVIGTLISACPAICYGWLYTKRLEREKFLALNKKNKDYEKTMQITKSMKDDLKWWLDNIETAKNYIRENKYSLEIFTDASLTGWGGFCKGEKVHGWWKHDDSNHINIKELKAVLNGLKCFAKEQHDCEILLRVDNTTAISYINKMGGIKYTKLNNIAREIWQWCEARNIFLYASYIKSKENIHADKESRKLPTETEWEIADWAFDKIKFELGVPEIDLFASSLNAKCKKFVSWKKDPDSFKIDAFTFSWKNFFFYAFPPLSIILKVLRKIIIDKAEGVVVVPYWPTQPWFPLYKSLAITPLISFGPHPQLLLSPFSQTHPLSRKLILVAAMLSYNHTHEKAI